MFARFARSLALISALLSGAMGTAGVASCSSGSASDPVNAALDASSIEDGGEVSGKDVGNESGPTSGSEICDRYLACAAATSPAVFPTLQQGYGPSGTCWSASSKATCEGACKKGLSQLRIAAPTEAACGCNADDECLEKDQDGCEKLSHRCGACSSSAKCGGGGQVCVRSDKGTQCVGCNEYVGYDVDVCGYGPKSSPGLWSSSPICAGGTCNDCTDDGRCSAAVNCSGIWECLRHAPVECVVGGSCCKADRCSALAPYVDCMNTHCASCSGDACVACSKANCTSLFAACQSSCK